MDILIKKKFGKMQEKPYLGLIHPHGQNKSVTRSTIENKYYVLKSITIERYKNTKKPPTKKAKERERERFKTKSPLSFSFVIDLTYYTIQISKVKKLVKWKEFL